MERNVFDPIPRGGQEDRGPLSPAQETLWLTERWLPGSCAYHIPLTWSVTGELDPEILRRALGILADRHAVLRSRLRELEDGAFMETGPGDGPPLTVEEAPEPWQAGDPVPGSVLGRAEEFCRRPFSFREDVLARLLYVRGGPGAGLLVCCFHHLVFDGWSAPVFGRELAAACTALRNRTAPAFPDLPVTYLDYAVWHREILRQEGYREAAGRAADRLRGVGGAMEVPTDFPRPPVAGWAGERASVLLSGEELRAMTSLARRARATRAAVLLAGFTEVLRRYSGEDTMVIGVPCAGRYHAELEGVVGLFSDVAAVPVDLSRAATAEQLVQEARGALLTGMDPPYLPFQAVLEALHPPRDPAKHPVFQHLFAMETSFRSEIREGDLCFQPVPVRLKTAKCDLSVLVWESGDSLRIEAEYRTDLYTQETIGRWLGHYREVLRMMAEDPGRSLAALALSGGRVSRGPLRSTVSGAAEEGDPVNAGIAAAAGRGPGALAVQAGPERVTHGELDCWAEGVARRLRACGVGRGDRVGVCLGRTPAALAAFLGTWRAGAAVVPLHSAHPDRRILEAAGDAGCRLLWTRDEWAERFADLGESCPRLDPRREKDGDAAGRPGRWVPSGAEDPCYLIYTSGTTGRPKAVVVTHGNLAAYCAAAQERFRFQPGWSAAVLQSLAVDFAYTSLFPLLLQGGAVRLFSREESLDPRALSEAFREARPEVLKITPSHLAGLLRQALPADLLPSRRLILGGEASALDWVLELRRAGPELMEVHNHYGPTETTVGVLTWEIPLESGMRGGGTPLGTPLGAAEVVIRDRFGNALPEGACGEICVAGPTTAQGYWNDPALTAQRFVWIDGPAGRRREYRTGDRGRLRTGGIVEFRGRRDDQVKIRGHRVETGEVAGVLRGHPGVAAAEVLAAPGADGLELRAYVVPGLPVCLETAGEGPYLLPNGMAVRHVNRHETGYLYDEIFLRRAYLRGGVTLQRGDTVVDVGGNIGLFSLFARAFVGDGRQVVVEPNPLVADVLQANLRTYAPAAELHRVALAEAEGEAVLTVFPGFTLFSGLAADPVVERSVVEAYLRNQAVEAPPAAEPGGSLADLLDQRFRAEKRTVRKERLSGILRRAGLERVDLLKINAEKSERAILEGIDAEDWPRIRQVVLESDVEGELPLLQSELEARGFVVRVEQDPLLRDTALRYLYAVRPERLASAGDRSAEPDLSRWPSGLLAEEGSLRAYLAERLPESMRPSVLRVVPRIPLAAHGKVDRAALLACGAGEKAPEVVPPALSETERRLAGIWESLLGSRVQGPETDFFDAGGHSLLALRVIAAVKKEFGVPLRLMTLFEKPVLADLAGWIDTQATPGQA